MFGCGEIAIFRQRMMIAPPPALTRVKVTFSMKVGLAEIKEDDPDDTTCDKRKKTSF